jgi:hypothetical protein
MLTANRRFTFEISLSVLDNLGKHLYRSFATVLGEALSNAWDADARHVWIYIDANRRRLWVKDDGIGMTADDFQNKFLKIGYSKRRQGTRSPKRGRPYIGRKGIGKLALLSCARRITVISKTRGGSYVGGVIDNPTLDSAITDDLNPQQFPLGKVKLRAFSRFTKGHRHGTIIRFEDIKDGVKRSVKFLSKILALYFRFSLVDPSFTIFVNGIRITHKHLEDLVDATEFLWTIGTYEDPYVKALVRKFLEERGRHEVKAVKLRGVTGFIASVNKPQDLKIMTTEERIGIDLFVNGRVREKAILSHVPTARIAESYLYGQIHFDELDDDTDRFTASREGIVADDPKYQEFLGRFREAVLKIVDDWDEWRRKHREDGDPENPRLTRSERASLGLYNAVAKGYEPPKKAKTANQVERWVNALSADATFNFESYAECFVSENLVRKYIVDRPVALTSEAIEEATKWKTNERENKGKGNISIDIRKEGGDLSYLSMDHLANLVDKAADKIKQAALSRDAAEFKPIRDAVAHTALLTDQAKAKLRTVRENIKARVKTLLAKDK